MMTILFGMMALATILVWFRKRMPAIIIFFITLIGGVFWYIHHITDALKINL